MIDHLDGPDPASGGSLIGGPRDGAWRPFFRLVGLLFVIFPVATILSTRPDPLIVAIVVSATVLFGFVMVLGMRIPRPGPDGIIRPAPPPRTAAEIIRVAGPATAAVAGLIGLSVALTLLRPEGGWFAFFYYASVGASTIRVPRVSVALMVATGLAAGTAFVVARDNPADAFVQGLSVTVIGLTVFSAIAVRRTNRALVAARDELARLAVADERARIARDLHDTLGHDLSVIALKSELAGRLVRADPDRAAAEIGDVERVAREALTAVRATIGGYRQPTLASELAGARSALAAAGVDGRVEPAPDGLPAAVDAILAWAVREGVTNVLRHGRGRSAEVRVVLGPGEAAIEVRNDAAPATATEATDAAAAADGRASASPAAGAGSGLAGLRERVATVGGSVEAGPLAGGGFRLRVTVPLPPAVLGSPAAGEVPAAGADRPASVAASPSATTAAPAAAADRLPSGAAAPSGPAPGASR